MSNLASKEKLAHAAGTIRNYVDAHTPEPYITDRGSFLVCYAQLETPKAIGERTARFLRLFKGVKGDAFAGVIYNEYGFKAEPNETLPEMPVRSLIFRLQLMASTHTFEGGWDANDYPIRTSIADEVIADVAAATPYVPLPRPKHVA